MICRCGQVLCGIQIGMMIVMTLPGSRRSLRCKNFALLIHGSGMRLQFEPSQHIPWPAPVKLQNAVFTSKKKNMLPDC